MTKVSHASIHSAFSTFKTGKSSEIGKSQAHKVFLLTCKALHKAPFMNRPGVKRLRRYISCRDREWASASWESSTRSPGVHGRRYCRRAVFSVI